MNKVVTRIAPSPTGRMHIGTVRTALFNYLFAKHHGGTYFLRIEDTDKERNRPEWTQAILDDFAWCGLTPDSVYIQSEHQPRHKELLHSLVGKGSAYVSKEQSKEDPTRTVEVVRLKNPGKEVTFQDKIRGDVTFDTTELGDFVIARSIDDPLYHFAVVVDDADADVTHVIRAEEHLSNTPRQILIQEALGLPRPQYAHIPLILAGDRSKLSKRKHGASIENYRAAGYTPEGIINYLALLGWNPGTNEEFFSLEELIKRFSLDQVHQSGAVFDEAKMRWFNREHLMKETEERFMENGKKFFSEKLLSALENIGRFSAVMALVRERIEIYGDIRRMEEDGEFDYFVETPSYEAQKLAWKGESHQGAKTRLEAVLSLLEATPAGHWDEGRVKENVWPYAEKEGRGNVLWPMRYALTGRDKSPDPFAVAGILGKDETVSRLRTAVQKLAAP